MFGQDKNAPMHPVRYYLMTSLTAVVLRIFLYSQGVIFLKKERPVVDYSKWLGPDWKPTYEGAGVYVANHTCYAEILMNFFMLNPAPAYVSKAKNENIPAVSFVMRTYECVLVKNRGKKGSKESKMEVL